MRLCRRLSLQQHLLAVSGHRHRLKIRCGPQRSRTAMGCVWESRRPWTRTYIGAPHHGRALLDRSGIGTLADACQWHAHPAEERDGADVSGFGGRTRKKNMLLPALRGSGRGRRASSNRGPCLRSGGRLFLHAGHAEIHRTSISSDVAGSSELELDPVPATTKVLTPVQSSARLETWNQIDKGRQIKEEPLGGQLIEGVEAEGKRVTITTTAGAEGNDRPLVHVCERWRSPELETTLLSKCIRTRARATSLRENRVRRCSRFLPTTPLWMRRTNSR